VNGFDLGEISKTDIKGNVGGDTFDQAKHRGPSFMDW
jgi:hypothetical protein